MRAPAANPREPRRHHYVPRLLMKRFAVERRPGQFQIQAFDKSNDRVFATAIENIAVESDFNALERDGVRVSLEAGMGKIESAAAEPIARIVQGGTLVGMTMEDRAAIDLFCALQFARGTGMRAQFSALAEGVEARARAIVGADARLDLVGDAEGMKAAALQLIVGSLLEFTGRFNDKDLLLLQAIEGEDFLLGDNPVAMQNARQFGPYGNIGLGVPGIEIYMPISSRFSLAYWCPTLLHQMREGAALADQRLLQARAMSVVGQGVTRAAALAALPEIEALRARLRRIPDGHLAGAAVAADAGNVTRLNSLQVRWGERFVMSRDGGFDIARRMIADDSAFRQGMRPRLD
jgi:hypothetical protein